MTFGSQSFQAALQTTGGELLEEPVSCGSFCCHAVVKRGGQGTVYLGTGDAEARSRVCAIKVFSDSDRDTLDRARRSLRTQLHLLDQSDGWWMPGIPPRQPIRRTQWIPDILGWDLECDFPWIAQDFRGANLQRHLATAAERDSERAPTGRSREVIARSVLLQVAVAMGVVHRHGVVHRDLKPDNILIEEGDDGEHIALCDFDMSKDPAQTTLTQTGARIGTPGYAAPEQYWQSARRVTSASDVYSIGMLAVFLYTGLEPWEVMTGPDLMHLKLDPAVAEQLADTREWVERALSFRPDDRPPLIELLGRSSRA